MLEPLAESGLAVRLGPARKILSLPPLHPDHPCNVNLYAPCVLPGEALYAMGGHIDNGSDQALNSEKRFADRIFRATWNSESNHWDDPVEIVNKSSFWWMNNPLWLSQHLESFVGCAGSPSVVKIAEDKYVMAFTATVNDPNCCTGEHPDRSNQYGSCRSPWSFFVLYWATSSDGVHWKVAPAFPFRIPASVDRDSWMARNWAALFYFPEEYDREPAEGLDCKGLTAVSMFLDDDGYYKLLLGFWGATGEKQLLARVKYDKDWLVNSINATHGFDFEVYDHFSSNTWLSCNDGRLPSLFNDDPWPRGTVSGAQCNSIARSTILGHKYVGCFNIGGGQLGVGLTNDLTDFPTIIAPDGAPASVLDPRYFEDSTGGHLLWAAQDSQCKSAGDYYGISIWQADVLL